MPADGQRITAFLDINLHPVILLPGKGERRWGSDLETKTLGRIIYVWRKYGTWYKADADGNSICDTLVVVKRGKRRI